MTRALKSATYSSRSSVRMGSVGSRASWTSLASPGSLVPRETSSVSTSRGLNTRSFSLISGPRARALPAQSNGGGLGRGAEPLSEEVDVLHHIGQREDPDGPLAAWNSLRNH